MQSTSLAEMKMSQKNAGQKEKNDNKIIAIQIAMEIVKLSCTGTSYLDTEKGLEQITSYVTKTYDVILNKISQD